MKREAAIANHGVHSRDQIKPVYVGGSTRPSLSGLLSPGHGYLDVQGYPTGDLDSYACRIAGSKWNWPDSNSQLRSTSNYAKTKQDGAAHKAWLNEESTGQTFGSNSLPGWNEYGHVTKRDGARCSHSVHRNKERSSIWPIKCSEISPSSIYNLKVLKNGKDSLHVPS